MGEEINKSLYNEASLKMIRLDRSQSRISDANLNPLSFNDTIGKYGYQIILTELNNLLGEVWGKLKDTNKTKITNIRSMVLDIMELKPIHITNYVNGIAGQSNTLTVNQENWKFLRELLFKYHMEINVLLDEAGYSTLSADDDEGDPFN